MNESGTLSVTVATTGVDPDPDGYTVTVGGFLSLPVGSTGTTSVHFADLVAGVHQVDLSGVAGNCTVGQTPLTVTVTAGDTTTVNFAVTCLAAVGDLNVAVTTSGPDPDPDGYTVTVDGTVTQAVAGSGTVAFPGISMGSHTVTLTGIAPNCTVDQSPKTATVAFANATTLTFEVSCVPATGDLAVSVATAGVDLDPDGYTVTVDASQNQPVSSNGTVSFVGLVTGDHSVALTGIASNCTVDQSPKTATVTFGNSATLPFTVTCTPLAGTLDVTVATTGSDPDPDGYTVTVDGSQNQTVSSNGTVSFAGLAAGDHSVSLTGVAPNCGVDQTPKTATVISQGTVSLAFTVSCVPAVGNLQVAVTTTGSDPDADGYTVTVDGSQNRTVASNGAVTFTGLAVGNHSVALTGVAPNCTVDQTPKTASVSFGSTNTLAFTVTCVPAVGNLAVTVTTTGTDLDPDGYTVTVDGTQSKTVTINGTVTFTGLAVGDRSVALSGLAPNCTVDQTPKTATVPFGGTATVAFSVTCANLVGNLNVTVSTTGPDPDPDGYTVTVDGAQSQTVPINGTVSFTGLAVGSHSVNLTGIAPNCTVDQTPKTVTVTPGGTTQVTFTVTCVPLVGNLLVTVATSGADPDPDGYTVTVDGTQSRAVTINGFANFADLTVGNHQVTLTGIAPNCSVDQSPKTATVVFGNTTVLNFAVTCVPDVGDLDVAVTTTGPNPDPNGYTVTVDGTQSQSVASSGIVTFAGLSSGDHSVALSDVAPNCTVDQTPKTGTVVFGGTVTVSFTVTCTNLVGDLDVTVTTTGPDPDPDGYTVTVDGTQNQAVSNNGTVTFTGLAVGDHTVHLSGLALNCSADQTPKTASVQFGTTVTVNFTVTCVDLLGNLDVTVSTAGSNPDPDGYTVTVDGTQSQSVTSNGTVTFIGLTDGPHTVSLSGVANNCTVAENPQVITVVPYQTVTAFFTVSCTSAVGNLDVSVTTTGTGLDPDGYTAIVDGTWSQNVATNGTTTFIGLPAGTRSVELTGIASNCTVDQSPKLVLVVQGTTVTLNFVVTCNPILVGAGDIARCGMTTHAATADLLDAIAGTVFTTGDGAYEDGTLQEYMNCYDPTWGRHKARTRPSPGNHDYQTPGAAGYFGYYGAAAGDPSEGYYSYDLGSWHIVVLNSNVSRSANSPQMLWLQNDLAASTATCTLAYWHHPLFSSAGNDPDSRPAWDVLYAAGADVIVNGHRHNYERFAPQTPTGAADPTTGIRQFIVGTGGDNLHGFGTIRPNSEARNSNTHGVLKLNLNNGSYSWEFVPVAGQTYTDSGSGTCH